MQTCQENEIIDMRTVADIIFDLSIELSRKINVWQKSYKLCLHIYKTVKSREC